MKPQLKPLAQQVIVITGASSGIGLVTAREAARRGASLVLAARSEKALLNLVDELARQGHEAVSVVADVGKQQDVGRIAAKAVEHFGGFDTWVSNAGVSIYGSLSAASIAEYRRLFDVNFWGAVYGGLLARNYLKSRGGGAIILVGSAASDFSLPVQGMYSVSKQALKGFADALRLETDHASPEIAVSLIKPASINTPLPDHAINHMGLEPRLPPPIYEPETVARAILYAAEHPAREIAVGLSGRIGSLGKSVLPALADRILNTFARDWQAKNEPDNRAEGDILFEPTGELRERHRDPGTTFRISPYTLAVTTRKRNTLALGAAALALGGVLLYRRQRSG